MSFIRGTPLGELDDVIARYHRTQAQQAAKPARTDWTPAVDISETAGEYRLSVELPAVKREDVKVSVDQGVLSIAGERHQEAVEGEVSQRRVERRYGSFKRDFNLPENVDENAIRADYKDGILSLVIPKVAKPEPRAIEVQVH